MGDRGVIEVKGGSNEPSIYFYTHWQAYRLPALVASGLNSGTGRWSDESYLNRILFDNLTGLSGGETGFGIACWCPEDAYRKVFIDHEGQTAQVLERGVGDEWVELEPPLSFDDFIEKFLGSDDTAE